MLEKVCEKKITIQIVGRREGDTQLTLASTNEANNVLGWKAQFTLDEAMQAPGNGNRK
jgi:UDP-glucose 4-epimerase